MSRIAAIRAAASGASAPMAPDDEEDTDTPENPGDPAKSGKPKKKDKDMSEDTNAQANADAIAAAKAEATKAANARFTAVMASEEYKGREALGQHLLGSTDMDANGIIATLAAAPKPGAVDQAAVTEAAEEAARKEMQAALATTGKSGVDANEGGGGDKPADDTPQARSARILANQRAFGGGKPVKA